jgi:hypothetical protein
MQSSLFGTPDLRIHISLICSYLKLREESNYCFSYNLAEHVMLAPEVIHEKMQSGAYARLAKINPVAAYNFSRLNYVK